MTLWLRTPAAGEGAERRRPPDQGALADGRLVLTVDPASAVQLASAARASYPNLVAAIAIAVAGLAASGAWPRLKSCSAPQCGQAFYDDADPAAATRCAAHSETG